MEIDYTTRDMTGNPEGITDAVGDWDYTYGADGRLTNATPPAGPIPDQPTGGDYGYDWVGNRATPPADPNEMVYNAVDQLTSWPGMYDYTYDAAGNLKEVRNAQGVLISSYTYNDSGLLETATYLGGSMTNTWDAMGNRIGLEVGEDEYSFTYDPTAGVPAVIEEETPDGIVQYFRTPNGALIARKKASTWSYYHYDELGSTKLLTDASGNVTDTYSYDAYGNVTSHNGSTTDNPYLYVGALGYYTHYQCPEVKLLQLGVRFYDTEIGRFTQQDPIGDGLNWYEYAGGNPMVFVDPNGEALVIIAAVGGVLIAGAAIITSIDWGTDALTRRERCTLDRQIKLLKDIAKEAGRPDIVRDIGKLRVYGKFEKRADIEENGTSITHDPLFRRRHTILSADYFHRNYGGQYSQYRTLLDETYHSTTGDFGENDRDFDYAESRLKALMPYLKKRLKHR